MRASLWPRWAIAEIASLKAQVNKAQATVEEAKQGQQNDRLLREYLKGKKGTLKAMAKALHGLWPGDKYRLLVVMAKGPAVVEGHADGFAVQPHSWPTQVTDKVIQVLEQLPAEGKLVGGQGTGSGGNGENVLGKTYRQAFGELDFGVRCQANLPYHRFGVSVICRMVFQLSDAPELLQINFAYHSLGTVGPFMQTQTEGG